jgi:anti-sigma28 factor (negative regulator of flagellin synthesis)
MFPLDLPIVTTRIIPLTKLQEATRKLDASPGREERASLKVNALRMERIDRLREAIANGTYRISAADIAEKIVAHMLANRPKVH